MATFTRFLTDLPVPKNISWWWLGGSLLGATLVFQMIRGYLISCFYTKDVMLAFKSVDCLNRDINYGTLIRHSHVFGSSLFFFIIYLHMGRGVYYLSFSKNLKVWLSGVLIYLLLIITSFVGYVLPWAQMSFWAATVITNFITVIPVFGKRVVTWVWGRFSVDYTTLMRFYTLHFILPSVLALLSLIHILLLHRTGSSRPLGVLNSYQRFRRFSSVKDSLGVRLVILVPFSLYLISFMTVSDPEQFIEANPFVTPVHIVPEWYFLPAYAILRSVPNKLGGVFLLLMFIGVLILYPFLSNFRFKTNKFILTSKILFWAWAMNFIILAFLGGSLAEQPFIFSSQIAAFFYFLYFFLKRLLRKFKLQKSFA